MFIFNFIACAREKPAGEKGVIISELCQILGKVDLKVNKNCYFGIAIYVDHECCAL